MNTCIEDGCIRPVHVKKRGLCQSHYDKMIYRRSRASHGKICQMCRSAFQARAKSAKYCADCRNAGVSASRSPENLAIYTAIRSGSAQDVLDAMRGRCEVTSSGCWEWQGHRSASGYGRISTGRNKAAPQESTHRVAFEYATGTNPEGMSVHHKCANRACCNPMHLELATQRENMAEMHARRSYEARIKSLEEALRAVVPDHPLIKD